MQIEGEELSVIGILRAQGYTLQEAMDEAGRMIQQRYRRWYMALADMPSWGSQVDRVVLKYLDGLRGIVLGSLLWRYVSPPRPLFCPPAPPLLWFATC